MAYRATIKHHSISRAREVFIKGRTLKNAKRIASREFGEGFLDHTITILDADDPSLIITERKIGERRWRDRS